VLGSHVIVGSGTVTISDPLKTKTVTSVIKNRTVTSDRERFGVTISSHTVVQPHVVTFPGVKVGPEKTVPAGKVLKKDLM
jgi:acetyltransferase-like isoleucine patch superfamily enzyme